MLTAEQLNNRLIGGSDVGTILGLNPYQTAEELRLTKLGRLPEFEGNDLTAAGSIFEDGIRQFYSHKTGRKVRQSHQTLTNPKYPWLTVHIDGQIEGEKRGLECKNVHWRMAHLWGKEGTDEIAEYYFGQPHTYMLVKDYPVWDVAAYFGAADLRIYTLERDKELDEMIIQATHDFWYINVLQDVPCEISPEHPHSLDAVQKIYPGTDGSTIEFPPEIEHWHAVMTEAKEARSKYDALIDTAKFHILQQMGNAAIGKLSDGSAYTRKVVTRKSYEIAESSYVDFRHTKKPSK